MLTGRHMVRDVSCKNCDAKLGWIYEFATEEAQRYKEGRVILERALVTETDGIEEHMGDDWIGIDFVWIYQMFFFSFCMLWNFELFTFFLKFEFELILNSFEFQSIWEMIGFILFGFIECFFLHNVKPWIFLSFLAHLSWIGPYLLRRVQLPTYIREK